MPAVLVTGSVGLLFSLLWASAFVAGKLALTALDPFSLLVLRFGLAGCLLVAVALWRHGRRAFPAALVRDGLWLGALNNALYLGLSFKGLQTVSPEATVLIVSTAPLMTTVLSALTGGRRSVWQLAGATVGFVGVVVVVAARLRSGDDPVGAALIGLGTLAFAIGTVAYGRSGHHHDPVALNGVQTLAGAVLLLPFARLSMTSAAALAEPAVLAAFLHLVLAVSILAFLIWLWLLRRVGAAHAASFHLANPVFGILLSAALFGTPILATDLVGAAVIVAALAVVVADSGRTTGR